MSVRVDNRIVRFGDFEVDLASGELRKHGIRLRLHEKPFQLLKALLETPDEVVTRKELQQRLWPDDTFVEFENGLNNAVSRLRETLSDSAEEPRYIETVPRRGYRFIAPVTVPRVETPIEANPIQAPVELSVQPGSVRRWLVALGLSAALILATLVYRVVVRPQPLPAPIQSIAVLPLAYRSPSTQPDYDYLAEAVTSELITELSKIKALRVISETSIRRYKGTSKSIPQIARELGADAVIEGWVERKGDRVRASVRLIHAATDSSLWGRNYERGVGGLLALESEIALTTAREVRAGITPQEEARITKSRTVNPEAYILYVKGRQLTVKQTEVELYQALDHFNRAIQIEPGFAEAFAAIAYTWELLGSWGGFISPREGFPKAKAAAKKALEFDDSLPDAQTVLAFATEVYDWDLKAAEQLYKRTIEQSPNYAHAHRLYSQHLTRTGRRQEALKEIMLAHELDPLSVEINVMLAQRLLATNQNEEALAQMKHLLELEPDHYDAYVHLAEVYAQMGKPQEAVVAAKRGVELSKGGPHAEAMLTRMYKRAGQVNEAQALLRQLEKGSSPQNFVLAQLNLYLGNSEQALKWLQRACKERSPDMAFLKLNQSMAQYNSIRSDARFQEVLGCVELSP